MNDYWDYLAHAQKGKERDDHKYVARVEVGSKNGRTLYRYFYSMSEWKAYQSAKRDDTRERMRDESTKALRLMGRQVRTKVSETKEKIGENLYKTGKNIQKAGENIRKTGENIGKNIQKAGKNVGRLFKAVKQQVGDILDRIGNTTPKQASEKVKNIVSDVMDDAQTHYNALKNANDRSWTKRKLKTPDEPVLEGVAEKSSSVLSETFEEAVKQIQNIVKGSKTNVNAANGAIALDLRSRGYDALPIKEKMRTNGKESVINPYIDQINDVYEDAVVMHINKNFKEAYETQGTIPPVADVTNYQNCETLSNNASWYYEKYHALKTAEENSPESSKEVLREEYMLLNDEYDRMVSKATSVGRDGRLSTDYLAFSEIMRNVKQDPKRYGSTEPEFIKKTLAEYSGPNTTGVLAYQRNSGEYDCAYYTVDEYGSVVFTTLSGAGIESTTVYNPFFIRTDNLTLTESYKKYVDVN